jgi:hypothetical protein
MVRAGRSRNVSRWQKCSVAGCLRPMKARGLCDAHYNRLLHAGLKPELPIRCLAPRSGKKKPPATRQGADKF